MKRFTSFSMIMVIVFTVAFSAVSCSSVEDALSNVTDDIIGSGTDYIADKIDDLIDNGFLGSGGSGSGSGGSSGNNGGSGYVIDPNIEVKTLQEELAGDTYGLLYPVQREAYVGREYYHVENEEDLIRAISDGLNRGIRGIVLQYDTHDYKYWEDLLEKNKNRSEFGGFLNAGLVTDYSVKGELGVYPSFNEAWQAITYYRYKEPEIGDNTMKLLEAAHRLAEDAIRVSPDDETGMLSYINERICLMTKYSDPIPSGLGVPQRDATGVFFNGDAVCAGYAMAFKLVLNILGIENHTLNNDEKPDNANAHIWNHVKVNGSWYHIDATWNDDSSDNTAYMHDYFMLTDEELAKKDTSTAHKWMPLITQ